MRGDPKHEEGMAAVRGEQERLVAIGEAAKRLGVCVATLRVWDREGRLTPRRTLGGHRRYLLNEVMRLRDNGESWSPR
jgi:hypothetical protein